MAAVTAVQGLPWLLLGGGLGVVVDRTDRRRLMVAVDVARAAVIVALATAILAHGAGLWLIYLTAFVTGAGSALRDTAAVTCVPRLVQPDRLDQANARLIAGQIVGNELAGRPRVAGCSAWLPCCPSRSTQAPWASRCCCCSRSLACSALRSENKRQNGHHRGTTSPRACAGSGRTATCGT